MPLKHTFVVCIIIIVNLLYLIAKKYLTPAIN